MTVIPIMDIAARAYHWTRSVFSSSSNTKRSIIKTSKYDRKSRKDITVPAEIWIKIFGHLKRPIPPASRKVKKADLYQGDLLAVVRVCKLFHLLASPILYSHVVVSDFTLFLFGPYTHSVYFWTSHKPKLNSNLHLVKRLDLIYTDAHDLLVDATAKRRSEQFLDTWLLLAMIVADDMRRSKIARESLQNWKASKWSWSLGRIIRTAEQLISPFPNVKTLTIGGYGSNPWDQIYHAISTLDESASFDQPYRTKLQAVIRGGYHSLDLDLLVPLVRNVCRRTLLGPIILPISAMTSYISNTVVFTHHIDWRHSPKHTPTMIHKAIVKGSTNRWVFDRWTLLLKRTGAVRAFFIWLQAAINTFPHVPQIGGEQKTSIEIYGVRDESALRSALGHLHLDASGDKEKLRVRMERWLTEDVQAHLAVRNVSVKFMYAPEAGPCPACGECFYETWKPFQGKIVEGNRV
ncbi:hypothetical protein CI109_100174 [Kwoniella shandongensis]|uniref:Uncharacterized protein n=1 Tax=Kwoniella shandongensis TaxID=1734106 RepID=A0A5M6BV89_9TREE|nr:uncharacterized protein CI109_005774 [Kwoniella shandongensis]KAA5525892.1 hypothetical protein CI109_005774 [Kwoniella shandongensis]